MLVAVLTQLFLATLWGKAVLAWLTPKQAFEKVDTSPKPDTEQQLLLSAAQQYMNSQSSDADGEQAALGPGTTVDTPSAMYVEMSDAHYLLRQHGSLQGSQPVSLPYDTA